MKKYGPKDEVYVSLFSAHDMPYVSKLFVKSRRNKSLIDEFMSKSIAKWNDHQSILKVGNRNIEFIQVSKADDLPTFPGLFFCCQQIFGITTVRWRYYAIGSDSREARPYQQALYSETQPRADMTIPAQGSATRSGNALRFIGIFPASFPTITVRESAVTQAVSGTSVFLNRNMFSGTPITHTVSVTGFTVACLLTFSGVV